jgi:hypothetical protein
MHQDVRHRLGAVQPSRPSSQKRLASFASRPCRPPRCGRWPASRAAGRQRRIQILGAAALLSPRRAPGGGEQGSEQRSALGFGPSSVLSAASWPLLTAGGGRRGTTIPSLRASTAAGPPRLLFLRFSCRESVLSRPPVGGGGAAPAAPSPAAPEGSRAGPPLRCPRRGRRTTDPGAGGRGGSNRATREALPS